MMRFRRDYFFPAGTRRLSSSNQFWTRFSRITSRGLISARPGIRNLLPSPEIS
jgi:hypothetical protein